MRTVFTNRIVENAKAGRPSFGVYVSSESPKVVEALGFAGLDYVRIDMETALPNPETVVQMIRAAHAVGMTPTVRLPEGIDGRVDDSLIHRLLSAGSLGFVIPRGRTATQIQEAVDAVKSPPLGHRKTGSKNFTGGYGRENVADHAAWANENIIVSVQVETKEGVDNIDEIVAIPGLDMVQSGRGDLSHQLGVPGQQYHPIVKEAEMKMVKAGLAAGKLVSVQYSPLVDPSHIEIVKEMKALGVQVLNIGSDLDLIEIYRGALKALNS
jgi:4-hydroxy-2-oxoheptanedioate aldolase